MAESTLTLTVNDLNASIGSFLGYGRGNVGGYTETAWTQPMIENIKEVRRSGLAQFYTPPSLRPGEPGHNWSFLRPFATLTLTSGATTIDLPDNFGGFEGPLHITTAGSSGRFRLLQLVNQGVIEQAAAERPDSTGFPRYAAEQVGVTAATLTEGVRSKLVVWPIPDAAYTLRATYKYLADDLVSGTINFPVGGAEHSETIKASCIAAAELYIDQEQGPMFAQFMRRLEASIFVDRKRKGTQLGYNGDRSDDRVPGRDPRLRGWGPVTYNGVSFDD